jgi:hypothetical protein
MDERKEELERLIQFTRSLYDIAGDWGDVQYGKLNELVRFLEAELDEITKEEGS